MYKLLERGANFADLARRFSEDKASKNKGGNIGVFGINRFERSFEDAAFSIKREGKYSKPVETKIGWHIIQLVEAAQSGKPPIQALADRIASIREELETERSTESYQKKLAAMNPRSILVRLPIQDQHRVHAKPPF